MLQKQQGGHRFHLLRPGLLVGGVEIAPHPTYSPEVAVTGRRHTLVRKKGGRVEVEQVEGLQGAGYGPEEKPHHRGWTLIPSHLHKYLVTSSPPTPPCQALPPLENPSTHFCRSSGFPSCLSPNGALWNKARLLQGLTELPMVPVPACSPGQTLLRWGWGRWINKMNK